MNIENKEFDWGNHVKLWDWLAKNPEKQKTDWPEWEVNGGHVPYVMKYCFACDYAYSRENSLIKCKHCPLQFEHPYGRPESLFSLWEHEPNTDSRAELAKKIRDTPVRFEAKVLTRYRPGDRVRIVTREIGTHWTKGMKKWLGKIMTIESVFERTYLMKEDRGEYSPNEGWDWYPWMIEGIVKENQSTSKITITHDDKITTATIYEKGVALRSEKAICSANGTFDFAIGAELALKRLLHSFTQCLSDGNGEKYGNIGETTFLKDIYGNTLKVGDIVDLFGSDRNHRGERVVVFKYGKAFVRGIMPGCLASGEIIDGWFVIKKRDCTELNDGENVDGLSYIKKEKSL